MTSSPFSARGIDLSRARLVPLDPACCPSLAQAIVAIPPWSVMPYPADAMARFLAASADGAYRYLVEGDGSRPERCRSAIPGSRVLISSCLRSCRPGKARESAPRFSPGSSKRGYRADARNLWVCASSFNERALRFYQRNGFRQAASLPELVADGYDEILLRKFPL